jgi:hypothetical protein
MPPPRPLLRRRRRSPPRSTRSRLAVSARDESSVSCTALAPPFSLLQLESTKKKTGSGSPSSPPVKSDGKDSLATATASSQRRGRALKLLLLKSDGKDSLAAATASRDPTWSTGQRHTKGRTKQRAATASSGAMKSKEWKSR